MEKDLGGGIAEEITKSAFDLFAISIRLFSSGLLFEFLVKTTFTPNAINLPSNLCAKSKIYSD